MNIPVVVAVVEFVVDTSLLLPPLDDSTTSSTETVVHKRQIAKMTIIIIFDFLDVLPIICNMHLSFKEIGK